MKRIASKINKENKNNKEIINLDTKHKMMILNLNEQKNNINNIIEEISIINNKINNIKLNNMNDIKNKADLLDTLDELNIKYNLINSNYNEIDYYNNIGDLIMNYYEIKNNNNTQNNEREKKDILEFLSNNNKIDTEIINNTQNNDLYYTKNILLEKYCKRITGLNLENNNNYIRFCSECKIEKILDMVESAYICQCCGDSENIIIDEDRQIKEYSPYRRLNHFREWLNQFQAKQTPDIPEQVFIDIVRELNKNRINDLSTLNRENIKSILKKLEYNIYYEHITYIINKLNNLPPPKITRDMEKIFISMFLQIQEPWERHKTIKRKNFMSYSFVIHKFCQLLGLNHLLKFFPLLKDNEKIMEGDNIWAKICKDLNWEYISSFK
jgi:hypothetical protein